MRLGSVFLGSRKRWGVATTSLAARGRRLVKEGKSCRQLTSVDKEFLKGRVYDLGTG